MPTCLARGNEIAYTIMPYDYDGAAPLEEALKQHRTDDTLGYVSGGKFIYTESGNSLETTEHWSLNILKEFPYLEREHDWIIYACAPEDVSCSFNELTAVGHTLHVGNWDIWATEEKKGSIAVVTSYEIY